MINDDVVRKVALEEAARKSKDDIFRDIREDEKERILAFINAISFSHWHFSQDFNLDGSRGDINVFFDAVPHHEEKTNPGGFLNGYVDLLTIWGGTAHTQLILQPCIMLGNWRRIKNLVIHELAHVLQLERHAYTYNAWDSWSAQVSSGRIILSEMSEENKKIIETRGISEEGISLETKEIIIKGGMHGKSFRQALNDVKERAKGIRL